MSLSASLTNALSGLNVNQKSLELLSNNIANANNPEYSRKVVSQTANYVAGRGAGVSIEDIERKTDNFLSQSIQGQRSAVGYTETIDRYSNLLQSFLGRPGAENSVDSYLTDYMIAWQRLAETPERGSYRLDVINSGKTLADSISSLASRTHDLRFEADTEIKQGVKFVNDRLRELHSVNTSIANAFALGTSQAELLDQRDELVNAIADQMDINVTNAIKVHN